MPLVVAFLRREDEAAGAVGSDMTASSRSVLGAGGAGSAADGAFGGLSLTFFGDGGAVAWGALSSVSLVSGGAGRLVPCGLTGTSTGRPATAPMPLFRVGGLASISSTLSSSSLVGGFLSTILAMSFDAGPVLEARGEVLDVARSGDVFAVC